MTHFALDPEMTDADWDAARRLARSIRAAKESVAAMPALQREQLEDRFIKAQEAARFHATYTRPR